MLSVLQTETLWGVGVQIRSAAHLSLSRRVATESPVLLENKNKTLPLSAATKRKIAVVGPFADCQSCYFGESTKARALSLLRCHTMALCGRQVLAAPRHEQDHHRSRRAARGRARRDRRERLRRGGGAAGAAAAAAGLRLRLVPLPERRRQDPVRVQDLQQEQRPRRHLRLRSVRDRRRPRLQRRIRGPRPRGAGPGAARPSKQSHHRRHRRRQGQEHTHHRPALRRRCAQRSRRGRQKSFSLC